MFAGLGAVGPIRAATAQLGGRQHGVGFIKRALQLGDLGIDAVHLLGLHDIGEAGVDAVDLGLVLVLEGGKGAVQIGQDRVGVAGLGAHANGSRGCGGFLDAHGVLLMSGWCR